MVWRLLFNLPVAMLAALPWAFAFERAHGGSWWQWYLIAAAGVYLLVLAVVVALVRERGP